MPEKHTLQRKINLQPILENLLPYLKIEQLQQVFLEITQKTKVEIANLFKDKALEEIRTILQQEMQRTINFSFYPKEDEDPETLQTFQELSSFIFRAPTLPIDGMAFRYVEYDNFGSQEAIQWILSCAPNAEFNQNISQRIDLREKKSNLLAEAALRSNPTIIKLREEKPPINLEIDGIHINFASANPQNFKTYINSVESGYREILCIPLIGKIFNSGLLTIFSKRNFDLSNPDTIAEIRTIQAQANIKTQEIQEKRFFKMLQEIDAMAENEREAIEKILKIMVGREGNLRCSIASFWKNAEKQILTQKSAAFPPEQHGADQGDFLENRPLIQAVIQTETTIYIDSPKSDPLTAYLNQVEGVLEKHQIKSILALPLKNQQGAVTDVIVFDSSQADIFTTEKQAHLITLVSCMQKVIHIAREMRRYRISRGERHDIKIAISLLVNQVFQLLKNLKEGTPIKKSTLSLLEKNATLIQEIEETLDNVNRAKEGKSIAINSHSLNEIYRDIYDIVQQKQLEDYCNIDEPTNRMQTVLTNRPILKRVLLNLFSNTQKHGKPEANNNKVPVKCSFKIDETANLLEIRISNPGHIPDEYLEKIFEPLFSTKNTAEQQFLEELHGQGLDMVKNLLQAMQGKIEVNNKTPDKVEFIVKIPLPLKNTENA